MAIEYALSHLLAAGTAVASFAIAIHLFSTRRTPQSLMAWLVAIVAVPLAAVPLYLALGTRKLPRRAKLSHKHTPTRRGEVPIGTVPRVLHGDAFAPPRAGNALLLHEDGVAAFHALLGLIRSAQRSIELTIFIIGDDVTGWAVLDALAERAQAGVSVRVILDAVGSRSVLARAARKLRAAGGSVRAFMPILHAPLRGRTNLRSHRKLACFDRERMFCGGMNIADEYMGPTPTEGRWRDLAATVHGPVVLDAAALFESDWLYCGGLPLDLVEAPLAPAGHSVLQLVPSGPDQTNDTLYDALLSAIFAARWRVVIVTPYYVPDDALQHALVLAARRQVEVHLVIPARSNHALADYARRGLVHELREAGGRVHRYLPGMLHAKAMIVDETFAYIGSPNFDTRSLFLNYEDALFIYDADDIAKLTTWVEALRTTCTDEAPARSPRSAWILEQVARLAAPEL